MVRISRFVRFVKTGFWVAVLGMAFLAAGCGGADDGGHAEKAARPAGDGGAGKTPAETAPEFNLSPRPAGHSVPLPVEALEQTPLEGDAIVIRPDLRARKVAGHNAFAVELALFGIMSDSTALWSFAEMESIQATGTLAPEERVFARFKRAIIHGDSNEVGAALTAGDINWFLAPRGQKYPQNGINQTIAEASEGHHEGDGHNH